HRDVGLPAPANARSRGLLRHGDAMRRIDMAAKTFFVAPAARGDRQEPRHGAFHGNIDVMTLSDDLPVEGNARNDAPTEQSLAASEVASAIAHQLNGPLTALLLYVSDLHLHSDRFPDDNGEGLPLRQIAEQALREAEYACRLLRQIEEACASALPEQTDIA